MGVVADDISAVGVVCDQGTMRILGANTLKPSHGA